MTKTLANPFGLSDRARQAGSLLNTIEKAAADPDVDVTKMERLFELLKATKHQEAEMLFNQAMCTAQQEMPRVTRDAINESTRSYFTRLETLNDAVVPIYTKHGFSLSFGTADCPKEDHYRITCVVSHQGGYSRAYQCDLPSDFMGAKGNPNKTKMHGAGSSLSYGRRYLTLLIFNITLVHEDDDGQGGPRVKPAGPSALRNDKSNAEEVALKKQLVDATRHIHHGQGYNLDDQAKGYLNQWLIDEMHISPDESLADLTVDKLKTILGRMNARTT